MLIVNADDWGRDRQTTDSIFECTKNRTVSSTSAMVFMEDSARAAATAQQFGIDAGLHLNFTEPFSSRHCPARVLERQRRLVEYLRRWRVAKTVFHPLLVGDFDYVVRAQLDEFQNLYGTGPGRLDGHHHMHLCANVLLQNLLPEHTIVRRNFTFQPGEKSSINRFYRRVVDRVLARRHAVVDYFFQLEPLEPKDRVRRICSLADKSVVEIETHPSKADEYEFLTSGEIFRWVGDIPISAGFTLPTGARELPTENDDDSSPWVSHVSGIR